MIETKALNPAVGVEVSGVENLLDDALIGQCMEALKWRGVLLVRGLHLDDETQPALSRRLGEVVRLGGSEIFVVTLDPSVNPAAAYLKSTFHWHLDGTTDLVPIKATMLTARHVATVGGGTEFASTYAAYDNLSEQDRKRYDDLRVVHTFEAAQRLTHPDPTEKQLAAWRTQPDHETPLPYDPSSERGLHRTTIVGDEELV